MWGMASPLPSPSHMRSNTVEDLEMVCLCVSVLASVEPPR
jgi:hypothetical protein